MIQGGRVFLSSRLVNSCYEFFCHVKNPLEINMSPKRGPFQKEISIFQPSRFRGYDSFLEDVIIIMIIPKRNPANNPHVGFGGKGLWRSPPRPHR